MGMRDALHLSDKKTHFMEFNVYGAFTNLSGSACNPYGKF